MTDVIADVRAILRAAQTANDNLRPAPLRLAPQAGVDRLLLQLNGLRPRQRTFERPPRLIFNPAPWARAELAAR
jgi:hypothetical protein